MMASKGKKRCGCRTLPPDVLSNLPENVIDDILMCLSLQDAVRTCILSKNWRYKWRRLPVLTLDQTLWKTTRNSRYIENIMDHILTHHTGPIAKFTLCIPYLESCPEIDDEFIHFLSRSSIQHLILRLPIRGYPYKLPSSFFTTLQLRYLTLHNCTILPQPSFEGFGRLISLELRDVTIPSELLGRLLSHCLLLEQLVLQRSGASGNVIEINAPKLRSFEFTGNMNSICLENIPLLAKLSLTHRQYYVGAGKCDLAKFFEPFSALEQLILNDMFFVAGVGEVPTRLPFNLDCVKQLCISSIFLGCSEEVSCALCLIRSSPYLQYLEIKVECDDDDTPALECVEVEQFSDFTFNHLKEVKLIQTNGTKPEMQLMKLLLAKSPMLVRMLIDPCLVEEYATVKILADLTKFQRASPKAEVVYNLDKHPNHHPV